MEIHVIHQDVLVEVPGFPEEVYEGQLGAVRVLATQSHQSNGDGTTVDDEGVRDYLFFVVVCLRINSEVTVVSDLTLLQTRNCPDGGHLHDVLLSCGEFEFPNRNFLLELDIYKLAPSVD